MARRDWTTAANGIRETRRKVLGVSSEKKVDKEYRRSGVYTEKEIREDVG